MPKIRPTKVGRIFAIIILTRLEKEPLNSEMTVRSHSIEEYSMAAPQKTNRSSQYHLHLNYEITLSPDAVGTPQSFNLLEKNDKKVVNFNPSYKFLNDIICGLQFHRMNDYAFLNLQEKSFGHKALLELDPYQQIYTKCAHQLKSTLGQFEKALPGPKSKIEIENLEKNLNDFFLTVFNTRRFQFKSLTPLIEAINQFEEKLESPLIYHFGLKLKPEMIEKLTAFYSFLFHLRTLVALDYNQATDDSAFENLKCDSISDYIPKSDFTVNDAILYWQFKKLSTPFLGHKDKDSRIEKLLVQPLERAFLQYSHNASALICQLPESYLSQLSLSQLEEQLHNLQMNWLLGSPSGLLFRIREELFGLKEGYSQIFWPEIASSRKKPAKTLQLDAEFTESDLQKNSQAA